MIFKNDYFYLSNFYKCEISISINNKSYVFKDVESAFQAQKNPDKADRFLLLSGLEAKKIGDKLSSPTDWSQTQLYAMAKALHSKFNNTYLLYLLKLIKIDIINDNYWGDTFWGVYKGTGYNILGKMLMNIRDNNNDFNKLMSYVNMELMKYV